MDRRMVRLTVVVVLAIVGLWLVGNGVVRVASAQPALGERSFAPLAITPTLQLVDSDGTTLLSSPGVQQIALGDPFTTTLWLRSTFPAPALIALDTVRVVDVNGAAGAIGLAASPISATIDAGGLLPIQLALQDKALTAGGYTVTVEWSAAVQTPEPSQAAGAVELRLIVDAPDVYTPTFQLVGMTGQAVLSSPIITYLAPSDSFAYPLMFRNPFTKSAEIAIDAIQVVPGSIGLAASPPTVTIDAGGLASIQLALTSGPLTAGQYTATVTWRAEVGTRELPQLSGTVSLVLVVDALADALDWGQTDFAYVLNPAQPTTDSVRLVTWLTPTDGITLQITSLMSAGAVSPSIKSADFITIDAPQRDGQGVVFTLEFQPDRMPLPGTYDSVFRASAPGVEALTSTFQLIVPAHPRGPYRLVMGELGSRTELTATYPQSLTAAVQFTGMRWLPVSTDILPWWPLLVSVLLLGIGITILLGYWLWAQGVPRPFWQGVFFGLNSIAAGLLVIFVGQSPLWALLGLIVLAAIDVVWILRAKLERGATVKFSLSLISLIGVSVLSVWIMLNDAGKLDLGSAYVDGRTLAVWEAEGRGPIHDMTITAGNVVNSTGDEGQICLDVSCRSTTGVSVLTRTTIAAGEVLTVPIRGISGLKQPGIYQGRILIQSPDIKGGVVEVPVQITVHDFIFWPGLIILLGVVAGAYSRYLAAAGREKLILRRRAERLWQTWDDNIPYDRLYGEAQSPIYAAARRDLDDAIRLLDLESEWGAEDAKSEVDAVEQRFADYQRLSDLVLAVCRASVPPDDTVLTSGLSKVENALCEGKLRLATDLMSDILRRRLPELLKQIKAKNTTTDVSDEPPRTAISKAVSAAEALWDAAKYLEAWAQYAEARLKLSDVVGVLPPVDPATNTYAGMVVDERAKESASLVIRIQPTRLSYPKGDMLLLRLDPQPEPAISVDWGVLEDSSVAIFQAVRGVPGSWSVEFSQPGTWTISARVASNPPKSTLTKVRIVSSRLDVLYGDKRRQEFSRQLLSGLLALIGGAVANRVFGFTFGSLEEYLLAFTWGVGVSYGVDQFSPGYGALKQAIHKLTPTETPPEKPPGA